MKSTSLIRLGKIRSLLIASVIVNGVTSHDSDHLHEGRDYLHESSPDEIDALIDGRHPNEVPDHVVCKRLGCNDHHGHLFRPETESVTPGPNPSPVVSTKNPVLKRPPPPKTPPTSSPSLVPETQLNTPSSSPMGSPVVGPPPVVAETPAPFAAPPPTSSPSLVPETQLNTPSSSPIGSPVVGPPPIVAQTPAPFAAPSNTGDTPAPVPVPVAMPPTPGGGGDAPFATFAPVSSTEPPVTGPTESSTAPSVEVTQNDEPLTYEPGVFTHGAKSSDGLIILSNGLSAKPIAYSGEYVSLADGEVPLERFHSNPDAAAVFEVEGGGWLYNSNAENADTGTAWDQGGVGVLEFDSNGEVVGYRKVASGTSSNCGGGATPWGSWISGEETENGHAIQIDPNGVEPPRNTAMGDLGYYESFAYDDGTEIPTFYITRDHEDGLITRFTPDQQGYGCYLLSDSYERWCTLDYGTIDYLYMHSDGSIEWITNLDLAKSNSLEYHTKCEGIDVYNGMLYFTAKQDKTLFTVDLRALEYESTSTISEGFEEEPDQIRRIPGDDSGSIYFCEDGGYHPGLHARTESGQVYTILHANKDQLENVEETTGLAWSPDAMHLYISLEHVGIIYDVTRDDKRSFKHTVLNTEYHK